MTEFDSWSRWHRFDEIFEYRGLIDETSETRRNVNVVWKGKSGLLQGYGGQMNCIDKMFYETISRSFM